MNVICYSDYYPFGMLMPNRHGQDDEYRYGFNGEEMDGEVRGTKGTSYTTEFRQLDPRIGRWLSTDPQDLKYPYASPYSAYLNNPLFFIDKNGDTLTVAGDTKQALLDLKSMVHDDFKAAIKMTSNGEIYIDNCEVNCPDNSSPDVGRKLVNDLINSKENYEYKVADNNDDGTPLTGSGKVIQNHSKTPRMEFNKKGQTLPVGVDGQVIVAKDAVFIATDGQTENRASIVFHELQENFERTDNKLPYKFLDPNNPGKEHPNKKGAHDTSIDKAAELTPKAKSVAKEGHLKSAKPKSN